MAYGILKRSVNAGDSDLLLKYQSRVERAGE